MADTITVPAAEWKATKAQVTEGNKLIGDLSAQVKGLTDNMAKTRAAGHPDPRNILGGGPWIRSGENTMTSRGFSFMKMLAVMGGALDPKQASVEVDVSNRLKNAFGAEYEWKGGPNSQGYRFLCPLSTAFMPDAQVPRDFRYEMKSLVNAGADGADLGEMRWLRQRQMKNLGYGQKDMSWLQGGRGEDLVAPPEMGELIELLRNKEALVNAGARVVPLPPQGRIKYPRQTTASTTYWIGENKQITSSDIGTGEVTLQAKKLAVLIKSPNELIRFASPAAEALMRDDMTKSLALALDLAGLEGPGGDTQPLGIINTTGINTVTSSKVTVDGDYVVGQDIYRMVAILEENNAEMETFVMRPKTLYKYYQLRSDAVAQGDASGPFLFNLIREAQGDTPATLAGYPVVKSTQVSGVQTKGAGTALTYVLAGMWSDFLIGMFGAIEFAATTMGDTPFQNDQTWVRGILSADCAPRHAAAFSLLQQLNTTFPTS